MKKLLLIPALLLILLSSCIKEEQELSIFGKWVLIDGYLFVDGLQNGNQVRYDHFADGKMISQLTGFDQPSFEIEKIELNKTTWEFKMNGDMILNDDIERPMYLQITGDYMSIIEHPRSGIVMIGGSARPFKGVTCDFNDKIICIYIQEQYGSCNGYNVKWRNELYFQRID